ncbi:hypothetical protein [Staphylococcus sp. LKG3-1]|uniref:hypothetical protein n=1 Tax=Staphylococcus TaxID=1279 RepID=UPI003B000A46
MQEFLLEEISKPPMWLELLKISFPILIAYFVYRYTSNNHKKTLLDQLDSKSEWRKKLFEVASSSSIGIQEVYTLRTSVRFDCKDLPETIFEKKTNEIIKFCDCVTSSHVNIKDPLPFLEQEMTRIYCRYLLANQWEILQLTFIKRQFYKLQMGKWYKKEQELDEKTNELINKLTP